MVRERQGAAAGVDSCAMAPLVFGNAAAARMRMRKGSGDAEREEASDQHKITLDLMMKNETA
jgi:hypothetical protein